MKKQIEKILKTANDLFVEMIIHNEFELLSISGYTADIKIFNKYKFSLWLAGDPKNFRTYNGMENAMQLEFTLNEQIILLNKFKEMYMEDEKNPLKVKQRYNEYLKLKKQFENS